MTPQPTTDRSMFLTLRKIASADERERVLQAARDDNDCIIQPSHVVLRGDEIAGAASLGVVPLVMAWSHTQKIGARNSKELKERYDSLMDNMGFPVYIMACNKHSPYHGHMLRFGFKPVWETDLFMGGTGVK